MRKGFVLLVGRDVDLFKERYDNRPLMATEGLYV